jgi:integrase
MPGDVNFYLKKAEKSTGKSLIYLKFKYSGNVFVYSFDQTIDPGKKLKADGFKNWSTGKQRVRSNRVTTNDGQHSLNDLLDNLEGVLLETYRKELKNGLPAKATLKEALDGFVNQNKENPDSPTFYKLLDRFISGEILHKGKVKSPNTIKTYQTLKGHLKAFEAVKKWPVDYKTINLDFLYKYLGFLRSKFTDQEIKKVQDEKIQKSLRSLPIGQNAIAKDVQILKTIMKKAVALKETNNLWFEHEDFTASREDTDAVYLTDKEILQLYNHSFSDNKKNEETRDLFVFGCYVGLRFSDYSQVKPDNIVTIDNEQGQKEYYIKMITQKTSDLVVIPCSPIVPQIFDKYSHNKNKLPKALSNQKFNERIKQVCKDAGFTEHGRLATKPEKELWECVSSHTARRSFATNLYLEGFPVIDLMKITGHRTEKAFMKYIRHSKLDAAKRLNQHMRKVWSEKLLKIA